MVRVMAILINVCVRFRVLVMNQESGSGLGPGPCVRGARVMAVWARGTLTSVCVLAMNQGLVLALGSGQAGETESLDSTKRVCFKAPMPKHLISAWGRTMLISFCVRLLRLLIRAWVRARAMGQGG